MGSVASVTIQDSAVAAQQRGTADPLRFGLKLSYCQDFLMEFGGRRRFEGMTTQDVCNKIIKPATDRNKLSFCEILRLTKHQAIAPATVFVCHTWKYNFLDVLDTLTNHYFPGGGNLNQHANTHSIVLWFDIFCINQHDPHAHNTNNSVLAVKGCHDIIADINRTILVLLPLPKPKTTTTTTAVTSTTGQKPANNTNQRLWQQALPFTRTWCLWELFSSFTHQQYTKPNNHHAHQHDHGHGHPHGHSQTLIVRGPPPSFEIAFLSAQAKKDFCIELCNHFIANHTSTTASSANLNINNKAFFDLDFEHSGATWPTNYDAIMTTIKVKGIHHCNDIIHENLHASMTDAIFQELHRLSSSSSAPTEIQFKMTQCLATMCFQQEQYEEALEYWQQAYEASCALFDHNTASSGVATGTTTTTSGSTNTHTGSGTHASSSSASGGAKKANPASTLLLTHNDNPDALSCLHHLAATYLAMNDSHHAEENFLNALKGRRSQLGDNDIDTIQSMHGLAQVYWLQHRYFEAMKLCQYCIELVHRHFPQALESVSNTGTYKPPPHMKGHAHQHLQKIITLVISSLHIDMAKYESMLDVVRTTDTILMHSYKDSCATYGENHKDSLALLANIVGYHYMMGDIDNALKYGEDCLARQITYLGEDDMNTMTTKDLVDGLKMVKTNRITDVISRPSPQVSATATISTTSL